LKRTHLWMKFDLHEMLARYGTASGSYRDMEAPEQGWLKGFEPEAAE